MAESVSPATHQRILAVAVDEVTRHPVSTVTMQQIAARAGVTTSSIYKAYANRYELFADACRQVLAAQIEEISHEAGEEEDPLAALRNVLASLFEVGRSAPYAAAYLYGIFPLQYHGHVGDEVAERVQQINAEVRSRLHSRIAATIATGQLHGDISRLTEFCLITSFGYIGGSIHHNRLIEPDDLADYTIAALQSVT